jgi:hypothetical protein
MWLYHPEHTNGNSPILQPAWEGLYRVVTQINDVVCRSQWHPSRKMIVVHLDPLAPYQEATRDKHP